MAVCVGINGFGRMGRLGFRAAWHDDEFEFVHVNEIGGDAACHAHALKFDSLHGAVAAAVLWFGLPSFQDVQAQRAPVAVNVHSGHKGLL